MEIFAHRALMYSSFSKFFAIIRNSFSRIFSNLKYHSELRSMVFVFIEVARSPCPVYLWIPKSRVPRCGDFSPKKLQFLAIFPPICKSSGLCFRQIAKVETFFTAKILILAFLGTFRLFMARQSGSSAQNRSSTK